MKQYEDQDKPGYTFGQHPGYQKMRRELMSHQMDILIVKDFFRFSRRNSRGLVELEDLRDAGVRIISIGDSIDFPNDYNQLRVSIKDMHTDALGIDKPAQANQIPQGVLQLLG